MKAAFKLLVSVLLLFILVSCGGGGGTPATEEAAPVANAGLNQTILLGETALLDGSASVSPAGGALSYRWTLDSKAKLSAAPFNTTSQAVASFTPDQVGQYKFSLTVWKGANKSEPATVTLTVLPNLSPLADAGVNQTVRVGTQATLDGGASLDPEGGALKYTWTLLHKPFGSAAALTGVQTASPILSTDLSGHYVVGLMVSDGVDYAPTPEEANARFDTVEITALDNGAPLANAGADQSAIAGQVSPVSLSGAASSDPDGDALSYSWSLDVRPALSQAVLTSTDTVDTTFLPDLPGSYVARLMVSDGTATSIDSVYISVGSVKLPVAVAGSFVSTIKGRTVSLDGSQSFDPQGNPLTYFWKIESKPLGSAAALDSATAVNPSVTVDLTGRYTVSLTVNNGIASSLPSSLVITAVDVSPVADAGDPIIGAKGEPVTLNGARSWDADGLPLTYSWSALSFPAGGAPALQNATTATPTFVPLVEGIYEFQLLVNNGTTLSAPSTVKVTVPIVPSAAGLGFKVVDAEPSTTLDPAALSIIAVSTSPDSLKIINAENGAVVSIALEAQPNSVSVSPDGLFAAVGHNGKISYVDLANQTVVKVIALGSMTNALDVILTGPDYVYTIPAGDTFTQVHSVRISDGAELVQEGNPLLAGSVGKLLPGTSSLFVVGSNVRPHNLEKLDLSAPMPVYAASSDFEVTFGGNLWFPEDGSLIFTRTGHVISPATMLPNVGGERLQDVTEVEAVASYWSAGKVYAIAAGAASDMEVRVFDKNSFNFVGSMVLPQVTVSNTLQDLHGRYAFVSPVTGNLHVLAKIDPASGLSDIFALVSMSAP